MRGRGESIGILDTDYWSWKMWPPSWSYLARTSYHSLDIGPGSDKNGIKKMLKNHEHLPNVFLQAGSAVASMNLFYYWQFFAENLCFVIFTCFTTHFSPSTLFSLLVGWLWPSDWRLSSDASKGPWGGIFWLLFAPIGSFHERIRARQ